MVSRPRPLLPLLLLAFAVPLAFAAFTQHAWEDYFITLRASRHLVEGRGLVFNPGDRLHTFTSPLGVLLPALCTWVTGPGREQAALWLFRILSAGCLAAAVTLAWRRSAALGLGTFARVVLAGLLLADAKLMDFATNGMETALLVFFVLALWSELEAPEGPRTLPLAGALAGLMWTRPDAFILAGALLVPHVVLRRGAQGDRRVAWGPLLRGGLLGGLLYLPWFAWAWWYYGSPIPHTIVAKSVVTPPVQLTDFLLIPWRTLTGQSLLQDLFLPAYWPFGGWPAALNYFGAGLAGIAAFAWLVRALPLVTRRLSLAVFLGGFYVCSIILFPWYSPPWAALAILTVAFTLDHALRAAGARRLGWAAASLRVGGALVLAVQVALLLAVAWEMRVQQRTIENQVRRPIGEWLRQQAAPGDSVFLEPLGYIGYFSQLKTYDYPGLSSREVTAAVRGGARRFTEVIAVVKPTWLVLRPNEIADASRPENAALRDYELVRTWNVRAQLDAVPFLPGRAWLEHDAEFRVFRRRAPVSP